VRQYEQECGVLSLRSQAVDSTGCNVEIGIRSAENEQQNAAVENAWESFDACKRDGNNKG